MSETSAAGFRLSSEGSDQGEVLTKVHKASLDQLVERIEDDGYFHETTEDTPFYQEDKLIGSGTYYGSTYIRDTGQAIRELALLRLDAVGNRFG